MKQLSLPVYNLAGKEVGNVDLNPAVFQVEGNQQLVHQAVVSMMANRRPSIAHTKDRGEVQGTNKKPWRQKGTGNARVGSARSPIWRGGGITFGPRNERNYSVRMPQKMRQGAFKLVLTGKVADKHLIVVDDLNTLDGKTKTWATAYAALPTEGGALVVSEAKNDMVDRSIRNVPTQKYVPVEGVTIADLVRYPFVVISQEALTSLTNRLAPAEKAKA
jgi:large subunit ribosomal protein L4